MTPTPATVAAALLVGGAAYISVRFCQHRAEAATDPASPEANSWAERVLFVNDGPAAIIAAVLMLTLLVYGVTEALVQNVMITG